MTIKFETWLAAQHQREDSIGAFARGLNVENLDGVLKKGKNQEHVNWVNIVLRMKQPAYVTTFNVAWQEFLLEKAASEAQHEQTTNI